MEIVQLRGHAVTIYKNIPAQISVKYEWAWISASCVEL